MLCDLKSGVGAMRMVDATGQQGTVISRAPTPGITRDERGTRPAEEAKVCSAETRRPRQGKEVAQATQPVSVAEPGVGAGWGDAGQPAPARSPAPSVFGRGMWAGTSAAARLHG